jgi:GNAT superfamily N-acetyltransferase
MPPRLRPATPRDLDALARLSAALYAEHPGPVPMTRAKVAATLAHLEAHPESGGAWLLGEGVEADGYLLVARHWSNEFAGPIAIVDELYLVPGARGGGAGGAVLRWLEAEERRRGTGALMLEVDDDNPRARRLYERHGYALTGRHHLRKAL